jgi:hypothetical protein
MRSQCESTMIHNVETWKRISMARFMTGGLRALVICCMLVKRDSKSPGGDYTHGGVSLLFSCIPSSAFSAACREFILPVEGSLSR